MNLFNPQRIHIFLRQSRTFPLCRCGQETNIQRDKGIFTTKSMTVINKGHHIRSFQTHSSLDGPKKEGHIIDVPKVDHTAFCKIRTLEVNKTIFNMKKEATSLDKVVHWILKKNIKVPDVSLNTSQKVFRSPTNTFYKLNADNSQLRAGFFTPDDDDQVSKNIDKLKKAFSIQNDDNEFLKELFARTDDKHYKVKVNIVGHFLAQGLKAPRLASEVFNRAKTLFADAKGTFTQDEVKIIEMFMKKEAKSHPRPFVELSNRLGRSYKSVREYYLNTLKHKGKLKGGRFSLEENKKILETILSNNINALDSYVIDKGILENLSEVLQRKPRNISTHWICELQPILTRYEANVLDVDFRHVLINYCVDNGIIYNQDADWSSIIQEPMFKGTTKPYLAKMYANVKVCARQCNPKLTRLELTSETLQKYLNTHARTQSSREGRQEIDDLISFYNEFATKQREETKIYEKKIHRLLKQKTIDLI